MINNRQNGRRRGRGGGPRSPNNAPSPGNRQDNRSRGNAVQLHEKYKAMARDAQLAGDRVQSEYYFQFADHYFRVLSEGRARFEEQRRPRDDYQDDYDDQDEAANASDGGDRDDGDEQEERHVRQDRGDRPDRQERQERPEREFRAEREDRGEGRPRRPRPRRDAGEERDQVNGEERISLEVLPPAIAPVADAGDAPKPVRRRARRPREDGEEIAPAA